MTDNAHPHGPQRRIRQARWAVAALFFTNGVMIPTLMPRYPELKAALALSIGVWGLLVVAIPLGGILCGLLAGRLIRRFGAPDLAVGATLLATLAILLAGLAPGAITLAAALLIAGGADAITDVAQNTHGLRVERRYGRSILNTFHATWSIGAVTGGLLGGAAAALGVPVALHVAISGALIVVTVAVARRYMLHGGEGEEAEAPSPQGIAVPHGAARRLLLPVAALVAIGMASSLVEDSGQSWAALYLSGPLGAGALTASLGLVALVGCQFIGRLLGDGLVDRFGDRAVASAGGALIVLGMGSALALPGVISTIAGFGAAGLGVATLVPAVFRAADALPGFAPGAGLTLVGWLMRFGFLLSPPLIGLIAEAHSLRTALWLVPAAGAVVVMVVAAALPGRALQTEKRDTD